MMPKDHAAVVETERYMSTTPRVESNGHEQRKTSVSSIAG